MRYCDKCGWMLVYIPRSFQEHIKEIIGEQDRTGFWKCVNCNVIKKR